MIYTIATFADDTSILTTGKSNEEIAEKLQAAVIAIFNWTKKLRSKFNEAKSTHIN